MPGYIRHIRMQLLPRGSQFTSNADQFSGDTAVTIQFSPMSPRIWCILSRFEDMDSVGDVSSKAVFFFWPTDIYFLVTLLTWNKELDRDTLPPLTFDIGGFILKWVLFWFKTASQEKTSNTADMNGGVKMSCSYCSFGFLHRGQLGAVV